ncbi:uncharacterized protein ARMOST_08401 [Armillaria ostoyae]|uniref:Uncharacterized protein n=1 Tax=Armillaria ostoyae TaxID=47428 RepID=A0A284R8J5_ARMOS|nr:uncharacterized protein ARMOST_08401 [Armillaria ostoyae]
MTRRLDYGAGTFRGEALEKKGVQDLKQTSYPEPLGVFEYTASHDLEISGAEDILFAVDVGKDLLTNIGGNCLECFSTPDAEDLAHETANRILDGVGLGAEPTFCGQSHVASEKDHSKQLQSLLDSSNVALTLLAAYASVIFSVAGSLAGAAEAFRAYAVSIEQWRDYLTGLKNLEDEVAHVIRDREILRISENEDEFVFEVCSLGLKFDFSICMAFNPITLHFPPRSAPTVSHIISLLQCISSRTTKGIFSQTAGSDAEKQLPRSSASRNSYLRLGGVTEEKSNGELNARPALPSKSLPSKVAKENLPASQSTANENVNANGNVKGNEGGRGKQKSTEPVVQAAKKNRM